MQQAPADLRIDARLIVPMTARAALLERHSVLIRGGRILEVLPTANAAERYVAEVLVERPAHVLLPGLINANAEASAALYLQPRAAVDGSAGSEQWLPDGARFAAARLLRAGTTCIAARSSFPDVLARAAQEQGLRAHIRLPVADAASPWARDFGEYLSRALALRDEYRGHPLISTSFAPLQLPDESFARLAIIADELEATLTMEVHRSAPEIEHSVQVHGERPLERLARLGVLTPAFVALHMNLLSEADVQLARDGGIAAILSPHQSLAGTGALPPFRALRNAGISCGLGSGASILGQDVWGEMRIAALCLGDTRHALATVTCEAATILGLNAETGSLAAGRWADLCCVDISGLPALPPDALVDALILGAPRELVSDVWVAGRQLLADGALTRLDWPECSAATHTWRIKHAGSG